MIIYRRNGQVLAVDCSRENRENRESRQEDSIVHSPNYECTFDVEAFFRDKDRTVLP